jgi:hypothetical protein
MLFADHEPPAEFSDDRRFRYVLRRRWAPGPAFVVIGLNPSTADETNDDPTIRRCIGFARREGCGAYVMLNLFAARSPDPAILRVPNPWDVIGPGNDAAIDREARKAGRVVAAWGNTDARLHAKRIDRVLALLILADVRVMCLGVTKDGHPRHPLYLRADAPLVDYPFTRDASPARSSS